MNPLFVLGLSIALIMVLSLKFKISAFVSLLLASLFLAFATGMPLNRICGSIEAGMGSTLGFLAPVLALGAIIGKLMEVSGGAERLALTLTSGLGRKNAAWSMLIVAYLCGIPVFFQVGIVLLTALAFSLARQSGQPVLLIGLSMVAGLITVHCIVPPHPAAMAITLSLKADPGKVILYGLAVALPAAALAGPLFGKFAAARCDFVPPAQAEPGNRQERDLPGFGVTLFCILLPLGLMLLKTTAELYAQKDAAYLPLVSFIGNPLCALLIAAIVASICLGLGQGMSFAELGGLSERCLGPIAAIILVIGAAGSFNRVIADCGLAEVLKSELTNLSFSPLITAWGIALIMRFCVGSATVAMLTAAGFVEPLLAANPGLDPALTAVAIGAGAVGASHVTDPGFWFVKESLGLPLKLMFASYTLSTCLASLAGLAGVLILASLV